MFYSLKKVKFGINFCDWNRLNLDVFERKKIHNAGNRFAYKTVDGYKEYFIIRAKNVKENGRFILYDTVMAEFTNDKGELSCSPVKTLFITDTKRNILYHVDKNNIITEIRCQDTINTENFLHFKKGTQFSLDEINIDSLDLDKIVYPYNVTSKQDDNDSTIDNSLYFC